MKTLYYIALKYDYGESQKGFSFEYDNMECGIFEWALKNDIQLKIFHQDVNEEMIALKESPLADYIFHIGFNDHYDIPKEVFINHLSSGKQILSWDCDSSYRFNDWILPRKHLYTTFVTTHSSMVDVYKQHGFSVIKSQWGSPPSHYKIENTEKKYGISFIGQLHGIRPQIMRELYNADIEINLFGDYWEGYPNYHGRLKNVEEVVQIFNQSKINLNLQNPWAIGTPTQIKARLIQIPSCGAFQIATTADDVENYYVHDKEIVVVNTMEMLINKIKYYLINDVEREQIAQAGHKRTQKDHSWNNRFDHIFREVGLI